MITRNIKVPTGNILIVDGDRGSLECLSLGDYGRNVNVRAEFLGLHNEIAGVPNGEIMPLTEKWVVTISTQYGCSMGCAFCDVPRVGRGRNASRADLTAQVLAALSIHPEIGATKRLNVHYARMGEPTFNRQVLAHAQELMKEVRPYINRSHVHPVVSTMMPRKNKHLCWFLQEWCEIKNDVFRGAAGLQLSINSTSDEQREYLFGGSALTLKEISEIGKMLPRPLGRKYALNFAISDTSIIDAELLASMFSHKSFMVKITPIHATAATSQNGISTTGGYSEYSPYRQAERDLINAGFDVLVFVPSEDEDRGRITCGNAILSGAMPACDYSEA